VDEPVVEPMTEAGIEADGDMNGFGLAGVMASPSSANEEARTGVADAVVGAVPLYR